MHNYRKFLFVGLLLAAAVVLVACGKATPAPTAEPTEAPAPTAIVPQQEAAAGSGHADVAAEAFRHWDGSDPAEVPTSCAKCHSTKGYMDYLGADGSLAGKVDAAVPATEAQGITCVACHNSTAVTHTSVVFPGKDAEGNPIVIENLGPSARCMECHQGREAKASVDKQIADFGVTDLDAVVAPIKNASGRTSTLLPQHSLWPAAAPGHRCRGGYEKEGKLLTLASATRKATIAASAATTRTRCGQGDRMRALCRRRDHRRRPEEGAHVSSAMDYDGDGNTTEGVYEEIVGLQDLLYAQIQTYAKGKAGTAIAYSPAAYPYWFADTNGDAQTGEDEAVAANGYKAWTARLLKAAYNYQLTVKDPGKFAHGGKYAIELLFDSIADLGGDVSTLARNDAGHFAGDSLPFRDWDDTGVVPFGCVKCHTAGGLPQVIKSGGTVTFDSRGTVYTTGVSSMAPATASCVLDLP
jgi:hypothetical protein